MSDYQVQDTRGIAAEHNCKEPGKHESRRRSRENRVRAQNSHRRKEARKHRAAGADQGSKRSRRCHTPRIVSAARSSEGNQIQHTGLRFLQVADQNNEDGRGDRYSHLRAR